eukprot:gnl/Spiro4/9410_TR4973_c0_g1_i1.p1 gnl/Spiro4/9410_TR4973_c0_g1~~gnl/Spiro4/9410_TR4973_c0_g1_i1.p1  ORF type:complete len:859 (-),score=284.59 gnl/Spiro4/9410_TR4973_c0_g1_i1:130-2706(-)
MGDFAEIDPNILARAWVAAQDSGRTYYANLITKDVSWAMPEGYREPDKSGWIELQEPQTMRIYYYNTKTTKTEWSRPDDFVGNLPLPVGDEAAESKRRGSSFCSDFSDSASSKQSDKSSSDSDSSSDDDMKTTKQPALVVPDGPSPGTRRRSSCADMARPPMQPTTPTADHERIDRANSLLRAELGQLRQTVRETCPLDRIAASPVPPPAVRDSFDTPYPGYGPGGTRPSAPPPPAPPPGFSTAQQQQPQPQPQQQQQLQQQPPPPTADPLGQPPPPAEYRTDSIASRFVCPSRFKNGATGSMRVARPDQESERELVNNVYKVPTVVMESIEKLQLEGFASNHFKTHRRGILRKVIPLNDMLKFSKEPISSSLLKFSPALAQTKGLGKTSVKMFSKIQAFMGDRTGRQTDRVKIAQRLIQIALSTTGELGLQDELFCQIAKQCTANPKGESTTKGWELLSICLGVMHPGRELFPPYEKFIYTGIAAASPEVKAYANACKTRLDCTRDAPRRSQFPSSQEVEAAQHRTPMVVRIHFLDDTFKAILVGSSTTCEQAIARVAAKSLIPATYLRYLSIFESRGGTHMRCLDRSEHISDVLSLWEQANLRTPEQAKFYVKVRLLAKPVTDTDSAVMVGLQYIQAVHDVSAGHFPVTEADIVKLAALQLQNDMGDFKAERQTPGTLANHPAQLRKYVPLTVLTRNKTAQQWETELYNLHSKLKDSEYTQMETKLSYLNFLKKWQFHSSSFYFVEELDPVTQMRHDGSPTLLALNLETIIVLDPTTKMVRRQVQYADICNFGQTPTTFLFTTGSTNDKRNQKTYLYQTPMGTEICNLAQDYIQCRLDEQIEFGGGFATMHTAAIG